MVQLDFNAEQTPLRLLTSIDSDNPTVHSVLLYLTALHAQLISQGHTVTPVEEFFHEDDLPLWASAWAARPTHIKIPQNIDQLYIRQLLFNGLIPFTCGITGANVVTFRDRVLRAQWILNTWLEENNHPEESKEERRKRMNREAQERHKLRKAALGKDPSELTPVEVHALKVRAAYDEFRQACTQRAEAAKQWDAFVAQAQRKWEDLKAQAPQ